MVGQWAQWEGLEWVGQGWRGDLRHRPRKGNGIDELVETGKAV